MERLKIGITHGDTNGVGYEIILKAFADPTLLELCTPVVYGNPRVATYHRKACDLTTNFSTIRTADEAQPDRLNMLVCDENEAPVLLGQGSPEAGAQALLSLETAMRDLKEGLIDALVTAPINKSTIQSETFHFPGHTEYIQAAVADEGEEALMILLNDRIRVALVTTHLPVAEVPKAITKESIVQKLTILHRSLQRDFLVTEPRIAVLALNPHAGDGGLLGTEEQNIIAPAIEEANKQGCRAFGPYAADGFFGARTYDHFDAVLAMYHDQGLAAFKALAMDDGVNFTAGLSVVRTSPDHGTAYDIAGKGVADESSFRHAIYTAIDVCRNRQSYDEAHEHPLAKLFHERREDERRPRRDPRPERNDRNSDRPERSDRNDRPQRPAEAPAAPEVQPVKQETQPSQVEVAPSPEA